MLNDALKEIKQYFKSEQCTVNLECFLLLGGKKQRTWQRWGFLPQSSHLPEPRTCKLVLPDPELLCTSGRPPLSSTISVFESVQVVRHVVHQLQNTLLYCPLLAILCNCTQLPNYSSFFYHLQTGQPLKIKILFTQIPPSIR